MENGWIQETLCGERDWNNPRFMKKWRLVKLFKISFGHGRLWETTIKILRSENQAKIPLLGHDPSIGMPGQAFTRLKLGSIGIKSRDDELVEHWNVQVQICPSKFGTLEIMNMKCSKQQHAILMDQLFSCWSGKDWKRLLFFSSGWADDEGLCRWDQMGSGMPRSAESEM